MSSDFIDPSQISNYMSMPNFASIPKAKNDAPLDYGFGGSPDKLGINGGSMSYEDQLHDLVYSQPSLTQPASAESGTVLGEKDAAPFLAFLAQHSKDAGGEPPAQ